MRAHPGVGRPTLYQVVPSTPAEEVWMTFAICAGMDPELFFDLTPAESWKAKAICAKCPVTLSCLDYAIAHKEPAGIWGGKTPNERDYIASTRRDRER